MQKIKRGPTPLDNAVSWIGSVPSLILHTIVFAGFFITAGAHVISFDTMLLFLTTIVSLEAIYLAIFIQMTVNQNTQSLREVEDDIDEIQEDVEELGEDMEEIQEDLEELDEEEAKDEKMQKEQTEKLEALTGDIRRILEEIETLKRGR